MGPKNGPGLANSKNQEYRCQPAKNERRNRKKKTSRPVRTKMQTENTFGRDETMNGKKIEVQKTSATSLSPYLSNGKHEHVAGLVRELENESGARAV